VADISSIAQNHLTLHENNDIITKIRKSMHNRALLFNRYQKGIEQSPPGRHQRMNINPAATIPNVAKNFTFLEAIAAFRESIKQDRMGLSGRLNLELLPRSLRSCQRGRDKSTHSYIRLFVNSFILIRRPI
jgi:hypothetical protein